MNAEIYRSVNERRAAISKKLLDEQQIKHFKNLMKYVIKHIGNHQQALKFIGIGNGTFTKLNNDQPISHGVGCKILKAYNNIKQQ